MGIFIFGVLAAAYLIWGRDTGQSNEYSNRGKPVTFTFRS